MSPEQVARNQRGRLQGAMVEAVARRGYAGMTLRELVALAGVSKSTFYDHFESKQECFLSTFDATIEEAHRRVVAGCREGSEADRLRTALETLFTLVAAERDAAYLVVVESLSLGLAGEEHRERGWALFEDLLAEALAPGSDGGVSEHAIRAIVGGLRGTVYFRLRDGDLEQLPRCSDELVDLALRFRGPPGAVVKRARAAAAQPPVVGPFGEERRQLSWDEPPGGRRSKAALTQRERILRAAARVVCEEGYEGLSVPVISGAAGVSNQTFYENFESKRDAFLAAFDQLSQQAFQVCAAAFGAAGGGVEGIGAGVRALLEQIAADRYFARIAIVELTSAGPLSLSRAETTIEGFVGLLKASATSTRPPSELALLATGAGIFSVIRHEVAHGRAEQLPELAPEISALAVTPLA
jgi:AcrR family transcriptional regulator